MEKNNVAVKTLVLKDELKYNGTTVLTYRIEYPEFKSPSFQLMLVVINKFYKTKALEYQKYVQTVLYNQAVEQYKSDNANNYPIRVYEALMTFKVTYNSACIISLYFDKYEYTGGAHGNTIRTSQTWNLASGSRVKLNKLIVCTQDYKAYILRYVREQIRKDPSIYFEDYEKLIVENFNENNFYCTPQGIVFYYQQYDIAPYSSGIREFLIPYSKCVIDPGKEC